MESGLEPEVEALTERSTATAQVQPGLDSWVAAFVHVVRLKRFFSLATLADYDAAQFNVMHTNTDTGKITASEHFFRSDGRVVEGVTYRPGADTFVIEDAFELLNLYRPSTLEPTHGDVSPWLGLVAHIVPDDEARGHVLKFLAHLVQQPGTKINHALLIGGGQGLGKDSILKPIIPALGSHNVGHITPLELDSSFNDWILNKSLLVVEEVAAFSNRGLANRLKPLLAEPPHVLHINRKFLAPFDVPNLVNVIMMTNSETPLAIEPDDRRFFFYYSPAAKLADTFYNHYHKWIADHAGDVLGYLRDLDIKKFNPKAAPPMTSAKQTLIEDSRPLLRLHLSAIVDGLPDLVTVNSVIEQLPVTLRSTSPRALGGELRKLGAQELQRRPRLPNGQRPRVWALRRAPFYEVMSEKALAEQFCGFPMLLRPGSRPDIDVGEP